ncbi:MAG: VanZ family protein [Clostridium sp.]
MKLIKNTRIVLAILIVVCMGIIFLNSSQSATVSNSISKNISKEINQQVIKKVPELNKTSMASVEKLNSFIRKFAHFFQFQVLAILLCLFMLSLNIKNKKAIILTLIIVVIYASMDEFHQLFIDGRGAQVRDVFIDTLGGMFGIIVAQIIYKISKQISKRKQKQYSNKAVNN